MNVLLLGTTDILGGAGRVSWAIKDALEQAGHTVSMFVADKCSQDPAVEVVQRHYWRKVLGFLFATENLISTDWLLQTPEFKAADVIHAHNLHGRFFNLWTLQKMSKIKPVIWTLHDEWAITPHCAYTLEGTELKNGLYVCPSIDIPPRLLWNNNKSLTADRNKLYQNSHFEIVAPSHWLLERVKKTALASHNLHHIANGIPTRSFVQTDKAAARIKLGLPAEKKIILFLATAGKANTWKGWKYTKPVLEHFKNNPEVIFLNVGNFVDENPESQVIYRKHVANAAELALYYSAADVLLFTSIAENFPLVILEAMSCGLPIVSFKVGGAAEVINHQENGYLCDYKNTAHLITGLNWVLGLSPQELQALSVISSAKIQADYSVETMTNAYLSLYKTLLAT